MKKSVVKFIDLGREYVHLKKNISRAVGGVAKRGLFILGPEVEKFEKKFGQYVGAKFAVGVNSGTDAIKLSLKALGIGAGDGFVLYADEERLDVGLRFVFQGIADDVGDFEVAGKIVEDIHALEAELLNAVDEHGI